MQLGSLLRQIVYATVYVGIDIKVFVAHGVNYAEGLLCCRRVVKIDERLLVDLTAEYGEICSQGIYIEHSYPFCLYILFLLFV